MSILTIGTVAFDTIETPFDQAAMILGGSATYSAIAARYLADDVRLSAVIGGDFPDKYIALLEDRGIDVTGLEVIEDGKTFFWSGRYHYDLNNRDTLATHLNVLAGFNPELPPSYRDSDVVCLGNLDPLVQLRVLEQVEDPDLVICDTMNYWIEKAPEALKNVLQQVDVLIVNGEEARQLADEPNLVRAVSKIRAMGPTTIVVKKGEHGAMLFHEQSIFWAPALPLDNIVDPTGAGDVFMGGFAGHLARAGRYEVDDFKRAVVTGSVMASFVVEEFGLENILALTPEQIEGRFEVFKALSAVPVAVSEPA
ncbi:MAG TPA: PfkB family carbohydrate kinase [Rhodothermales bacterium]